MAMNIFKSAGLQACLDTAMNYISEVGKVNPKLKMADFFAGQCAISKSFKSAGHTACALDISLDPRDVPWL